MTVPIWDAFEGSKSLTATTIIWALTVPPDTDRPNLSHSSEHEEERKIF
jgi:hypothetical protein